MSSRTLTSSFPATLQDVSNLKHSVADAVKDLSSTTSVHASRAKSHFKDLAGHIQKEGGKQIDHVTSKLTDLAGASRELILKRPYTCIGAALLVGILIGLSRRGNSR